ncbi:MAG: IS21 family transposase [Balneolales bacterium]
MGYNPQSLMDIYEIIRRWHAKESISGIANKLNRDRKTVRHYIRSAQKLGLSQNEPLPDPALLLEQLHGLVPSVDRVKPAVEQFEPYKDDILSLINAPDPMTLKSIWKVLCERHEHLTASYSAFKRLVRRWKPEGHRPTWRYETPPGQQIQIDYGKVGLLIDPQTRTRRTVYAFIGTLSWSRYKFIEFVFSQNQRSFVGSHLRMFDFFGGAGKTLLIDCLKSGVLKADLYDPQLNPLYRMMAEHYGCFIDPARPGQARDKGKVERVVPTARDLFKRLCALDPQLTLNKANERAGHWCRFENGLSIHGTTGEKPYERFSGHEQSVLMALPENRFTLDHWKKVTVHVDQYVQFEKAHYAVSRGYVGHRLWLRATDTQIELYNEKFALVKTHSRGYRPGLRIQDPEDFPDNIQAMMNHYSVKNQLERAREIGPYTHDYLSELLRPHAMQNLRKALGILRFADTHDHQLMEAASRRALAKQVFTYKGFQKILQAEGAEDQIPLSGQTRLWVRPGDYFLHNSE